MAGHPTLYVKAGPKLLGPLSRRQLSAHLATGGIRPSDLASELGSGAWRPLSDLVDIHQLTTEGKILVSKTPQVAGKKRRIAAVVTDAALFAATFGLVTPILVTCAYTILAALGNDPSAQGRAAVVIGASSTVIVGYAAGQIRMLHRTGQTLGKKLWRMRVVGIEGHPLSTRSILLRTCVPPLIIVIPIFGLAWLLVGTCLFLFGTRRPLHDRLARTQVVEA